MKISNNEIIGERITKYRKREKLSQMQLSEKMDLSVTAISNLERGKNNLSYSTLIRLCDVLDICPCQLLCGARKDKVDQNIIDLIHEFSNEEQEVIHKLLLVYYDSKKA